MDAVPTAVNQGGPRSRRRHSAIHGPKA